MGLRMPHHLSPATNIAVVELYYGVAAVLAPEQADHRR